MQAHLVINSNVEKEKPTGKDLGLVSRVSLIMFIMHVSFIYNKTSGTKKRKSRDKAALRPRRGRESKRGTRNAETRPITR